MNLDDMARQSFKSSPNTVISWYLIASYCYYCRYESILSDEVYDKMCKYMLDNFDKLEHVNKNLVDKAALLAGTAYQLKVDDYPLRVRVVGEQMIEKVNLMRTQEE